MTHGEAVGEPVSDEAWRPRHAPQNTGSALLEAALTRENLQRAFKRVRANKGAAGVDGLDIDRRGVAAKPMATFKQRIKQLTRRSGGCSMGALVQRLRPYLLGWKAYFGLAQTPTVWRELDKWLRHRLRAIHLKHWRRGTTAFAQLRRLGASVDVAAQVAANCGSWWRGSTGVINTVLTIAYFDRLGLPRLS